MPCDCFRNPVVEKCDAIRRNDLVQQLILANMRAAASSTDRYSVETDPVFELQADGQCWFSI
jgi:hypothetical protein